MQRTVRLLVAIALAAISPVMKFTQAIPVDSQYLGQTPPGSVPVVFTLPVTAGLRPVERVAISSDGREIYYGLLNTYPPTIQKVRCLRYVDNHWGGPFDVFDGYAAPRLSVNDSTMYVQSNINDFSTTYYSQRTATGWSTPVRLMGTNQQTHYCQTTGLGNSYLSSNLPASPSQRDICRLVIDNSDTLIQGLGRPINTTFDENDLFVADDESYLLFSRNVSPGGDIFLSFKKPGGGWTNPKRLGEPINKPGYSWEYGQFVSTDGAYLFFTSGATTMSSYYTYWVKIDNIIDSLHNTNFVPYLNYQIPDLSTPEGRLFVYTVPDSTFIDDDGNNTLTYSSTLSNGNPLPVWLSFDPLRKTFSGTPTELASISVKVTATDSADTNASCVFGINVIITGIETTKEQLPGNINLYQNYPNPFNPLTTISFSIPHTTFTTLKIFNTLGQEIATLVSEDLRPGICSRQWNASNIASGMYFYRLTAGDFTQTEKLLLLR